VTTLIASDAISTLARDLGERSLVVGSDAQEAPVAGVENPLGNGDIGTQFRIGRLSGDGPLKLATVLETWEANSVGQDYSIGTKRQYRMYFRRWADSVKLETRNVRWLATNGKESIIRWTMSLPEKSRRMGLASVESVWTFALDIPFPVNKKRDFGRRALKMSGQRDCPADSDIEPLYRAAQHEDDPYLRSMMLVELNTGLRPGNQLMALTWSDVRDFDDVLAIVAGSTPSRRFKTDSKIVARLPKEASEALMAWRARTPNKAPSDFVWPRRHWGAIMDRQSDDESLNREYRAFLRRHGLTTWVRLAHVRHWIEYRGDRDGISDVLLAFIRGHSVKDETEGRLGYGGNRGVENVLTDQAAWTDGPCGVFESQAVVRDGLDPYMAVVSEYAGGRMTTADLANRMEQVRLRLANQSIIPSQ